MSSLKPSHTPIRIAALSVNKTTYETNYLSDRQLSDRIENTVQTHLSLDNLQQLLKQAISQQITLEQQTRTRAQSAMVSAIAPDSISSESATIESIATAYGTTCVLIWQSLWHPTPLSKFSQQIQQLCLTWAAAKRHSSGYPFLANHPTSFAALQAKWQNPHIQATLRSTTAQLQNHPFYASTLYDYPTCWAYLFGCTIHQLLQWNHQLTPCTLRELWP